MGPLTGIEPARGPAILGTRRSLVFFPQNVCDQGSADYEDEVGIIILLK
jgi:hypothetical protein